MTPATEISLEQETALLERLRQGNQEAFAELAEPWRKPLFRYILRMVANHSDAEDLHQDTMIRAMESISSFARQSRFKGWLFGIATHVCLDYLRSKKRWRLETQLDAQQSASADAQTVNRLHAVMAEPDFQFEIREHIAFCFSCVARTLEPEEQAALLLREVFEFSAAEAAHIMGVSQPVFGHRLSAARSTMSRHFGNLCALIGKQRLCWQCNELREFAKPDHRGPELVQISVGPGIAVTPDSLLDSRIEIVRQADLETGRTSRLHTWFFDAMSGMEEHDQPFR